VTHSAADWRCAGHHPPTTASPSASSAATIQFDPAAGGPAGRIDRRFPCHAGNAKGERAYVRSRGSDRSRRLMRTATSRSVLCTPGL
jgi:hypothetical protein